MREKIVTSQAELDAIPTDFNGRIIIKFGTPYCRAVVDRQFMHPVEASGNSSVAARDNSSVAASGNSSVAASGKSSVVAWDNSSVEARDNSSVEAWDNSSVAASGNSSVEAWGNSSVAARDNSSVEASGNSSVAARDNSSVEAWGNSSVAARGNSSVVARGNSSVVAWDNAQITDRTTGDSKLTINGNARIVYDPRTIDEFIAAHDLESSDTKVKLFKAVRKVGSKYYSDWLCTFEYVIGVEAVADKLTEDASVDCGHGIHMADKAWSANYGRDWHNLAILELEAEKAGIVVPLNGCGKVRALKATPIREVPLEECGLLGKMLAKRRAQCQ